MMRRLFPLLKFALIGTLSSCTSTWKDDDWINKFTVDELAPGGRASPTLSELVNRIERSDSDALDEFLDWIGHVDGESGEVYSFACSVLVRKDPTIFLRAYLGGDSRALVAGREAYDWSGSFQTVLDEVYAYRLRLPGKEDEREKIKRFVSVTTNAEQGEDDQAAAASKSKP